MIRSLLLIDHSGRGHALADAFTRTSPDLTVHYVPGCEAIRTSRVICNNRLSLQDPKALIDYALGNSIDAAFISNATALGNGFVDEFREHGIPVIGADRQAAKLETSKVFGKQMCVKYGVPVAKHAIFTDPVAAKDYARARGCRVVVKADGLCGGAGSIVCDDAQQACAAIDRLMVDREHGEAGAAVVIEDRLFGQELSFFALVDGQSFRLFPLAADYPKSGESNSGVTCGGVGAFSPHPLDTTELQELAAKKIFEPLMTCLREEPLCFSGFLYVGAMLSQGELHVLEINIRFGDPEAQVVLPRLETNLGQLFSAILEQSLGDLQVQFSDLHQCAVVAYQGRTRRVTGGKGKGWHRGWPLGTFGKGYRIKGHDGEEDGLTTVYLGQARVDEEKGLVTDGGRVLTVVGRGPTRELAAEAAYLRLSKISFEGMSYRTDIGSCLPWS